MVVRIYSDPAGGLHLAPPKHHRVIAVVDAPEGSSLETTGGLGSLLFVPSEEDRSQRMAWWPEQVLEAARAKRQGFKLV